MKHSKIGLAFIFISCMVLLTACGSSTAGTTIELEMTKNYSTSDPFIHEKLFYVSDDTESLELGISFEMKGENGLLEIADNQTKELLWSTSWGGDTDKTDFSISLADMKKEKEYVISLTCTGVDYVKAVVTSESSLVKERERPLKPVKE